ncbi:MAG: sigma-54 interaction domain-containing protein [Pseudobdellovibrionaceae bacterium]
MHSSNCKWIQRLVQNLPRVAASDANVLIYGESGTGKEVLATQLHLMSPRSHKELVSINCAAIPEALLESELFGYKKGAFTGADSDRMGLFELADGGTVFLDEIGDMPLSLQAKILRVLQDRKIRAIGGGSEKSVDFKLVSATHRNLRKEISKGRFREDLFYRLCVVPLYLPPLRQRKEDIPKLIEKFSSYFSIKYSVKIVQFSDEAMESLIRYSWPGNIRELENLIEQLTVMRVEKETIELIDLPYEIHGPAEEEEPEYVFERYKDLPTISKLTDDYIFYLLNKARLNQDEAAQILGFSRRTLCRKLKSLCSSPC